MGEQQLHDRRVPVLAGPLQRSGALEVCLLRVAAARKQQLDDVGVPLGNSCEKCQAWGVCTWNRCTSSTGPTSLLAYSRGV